MNPMESLIEGYQISLAEPGCAVGTGKYGALIVPEADISPAFPYLNAVLTEVKYDHANQTLIWTEDGQYYALRPREIRIGRVEGTEDARQVAARLIDRINEIWRSRAGITPRLTERRPPTALSIFRLLPQTNCRQCGYVTCLAFAADLARQTAKLEACLPLAGNEKRRSEILDLFSGA